MPVAGKEVALEEVVELVTGAHQAVGIVGLELDGVGAGFGGRGDEAPSLVQVAVVVVAYLGDDQRGLAVDHPETSDLHFRFHCSDLHRFEPKPAQKHRDLPAAMKLVHEYYPENGKEAHVVALRRHKAALQIPGRKGCKVVLR